MSFDLSHDSEQRKPSSSGKTVWAQRHARKEKRLRVQHHALKLIWEMRYRAGRAIKLADWLDAIGIDTESTHTRKTLGQLVGFTVEEDERFGSERWGRTSFKRGGTRVTACRFLPLLPVGETAEQCDRRRRRFRRAQKRAVEEPLAAGRAERQRLAAERKRARNRARSKMTRVEYLTTSLRQSPAERQRDSRAAKRLGLSVAAYRQQQAAGASPNACHKSEPAAAQAAPTCDIAKPTVGRPLPQFVRPSKPASLPTSSSAGGDIILRMGGLTAGAPIITVPQVVQERSSGQAADDLWFPVRFSINLPPTIGHAVGIG